MAQELPAIAVAPGSPSMAKQTNESAGGGEQVGAFRNALQSAIGEQSQESTTPTESAAPRPTHGKGPGKGKEAKGGSDAKSPTEADILQTLVNQIACTTSIDLTAILVRGVSPKPSGGGTSEGSDAVAASGAKTEGQSQTVAVSTVATATGVAVSQLVVQTAAALTEDALSALVARISPETKVTAGDQKTAVPTTNVAPEASSGIVVELPLVPLAAPENAGTEKISVAPAKDASHDAPPAKSAPTPGNNPVIPELPPPPVVAKELIVPDRRNAASRADDSGKSEGKAQPAPTIEPGAPVQKTVRGNDSARVPFTPQTVEEAIVKQAVESASARVNRVVPEKAGGTPAASGTGQTMKQPAGTTPVDDAQPGEDSLADREGKRNPVLSSAPAAKSSAPSDRASTFTLSRTAPQPSGTPVGNLPTADVRTAMTPELPIPLPRELSRAVVDQVIKGLTVTMTDTTQELRVTLKPESLGDVVLKMKMEDGRLQAQIDVAQPAVKAAVEAQLTDLRQALQDRGINVQRIDVVASGQSANVADGQTQRGGKYKQKGGKRQESLEGIDEIQPARSMGYNTLEVIM